MVADRYYIPGSFYRIDDRSGFKVRSFNTRKEWNNLIVDRKLWEERQPQDFVRGIPDNQTVPEPRPRSPNVFLGQLFTTLTANAPAGSNSFSFASTTGMTVGDTVLIMLDTGVQFSTTLATIPSQVSVTTNTVSPYSASNGNNVEDVSVDIMANIG